VPFACSVPGKVLFVVAISSPVGGEKFSSQYKNTDLPATTTMSDSSESWQQVPMHVINLDLHGTDRWTDLIKSNRSKILSAFESIETILSDSVLIGSSQLLLSLLTKGMFVMYASEIQSIADVLKVDVGKVAMMQLAYEMFSACTSIAFNGEKPVLWRTMDWNLPALADLTVQLCFQRGGKTVFKAASWLGYVGILTGTSAQGAIAVNYRRSGDTLFSNLWSAIRAHWPVGFLVRFLLEDSSQTYDSMTHNLRTARLISPVYFILIGTRRDEACLVTRDRTSDSNLVTLESAADGSSWYQSGEWLLQTNMDHWRTVEEAPWQDIEWSDHRRRVANEWLRQEMQSEDHLEQLMQTAPIRAPDTIYYSKMCPSKLRMVTKVCVKRALK